MKLNPDCIRHILLTVEENTGINSLMRYPLDEGEYELLTPYSYEEVYYHIKQCELSGFLTEVNWFLGGECLISDLTPHGHEFIANIRSDNNWSKTKETAKKVGSFSLDALTKIAVSVVTAAINKNL